MTITLEEQRVIAKLILYGHEALTTPELFVLEEAAFRNADIDPLSDLDPNLEETVEQEAFRHECDSWGNSLADGRWDASHASEPGSSIIQYSETWDGRASGAYAGRGSAIGQGALIWPGLPIGFALFFLLLTLSGI